jgi:hypothetical protein
MVQDQPEKKVSESLSHENKLGMLMQALSNTRYEGAGVGGLQL